MRKFALILIVIIAEFTGCAEVTVISVRSLEKEKDIYKGREISYKRDQTAYTELEINAVKMKKIYFYLYIRNNSDGRIEINPTEIFLKTYFTQNDLNEGNGIKYRAYDPEKALDNIDNEIDKTGEKKDMAIGLNCCFSFFNFAAHISDDDYSVFEAAEDAAGFVVRNEIIENKFDDKLEDLNSNREFWRHEVLRRTVLNPNDEVGGIVVIPLPEKVDYIRIHIPFEKTEHTYLFELKKRKRK